MVVDDRVSPHSRLRRQCGVIEVVTASRLYHRPTHTVAGRMRYAPTGITLPRHHAPHREQHHLPPGSRPPDAAAVFIPHSLEAKKTTAAAYATAVLQFVPSLAFMSEITVYAITCY